ncbi:MAG: 2-C-methyl-D-erythritol 4-phosphate cytidylyltransferase [Lachnospiraceae bacterium]|nr:2-C-methyl-D-erythritol 4-phosphate cytidylyltransferase [Lachnospiraceae bacterium]
MYTVAVVLAGGSGSRMGTRIRKQYLDLGGHPLIWHSLNAFQESDVDEIVLVCAADDLDEVRAEYTALFDKIGAVVPGGRERYHSVYAGLCAIDACDRVLIHDGARPFVSAEIIDRCLKALEKEDACVAAMPSKDTVKIVDDSGYAVSTPDRTRVWNVQTPQCFRFPLVKKAYDALIEAERNGTLGDVHVTDDAMVVEMFTDTRVRMIEGSYDNIKITTPEDMTVGSAILNKTLTQN